MNQKRILFFGDSNTYGYDPADFWEGRYPQKERWTSQVREALGPSWEVLENGMNGRCIPTPSQLEYLKRSLKDLTQEGFLMVMLGTNDLLGQPLREERVQEKMEEFLRALTGLHPQERILLIAPPYCPLKSTGLLEAFQRMNEGFRLLALRFGVHFQDAARWDISLSSDRVHFSQEGHKRFAACLVPLLRRLWEEEKPPLCIRPSAPSDLPRMLEIYGIARSFMAEHGNPNQWGPNQWPPRALLEKDIREGHSFVCLSQDRIVATFFFEEGVEIEPTYQVLEGGKWLCEDAYYGVVHRIATDGSLRGVGSACLSWAYEKVPHLRIDTHPDNRVMQGLLEKNGFQKCGIIHVPQDKDERWAYEKI